MNWVQFPVWYATYFLRHVERYSPQLLTQLSLLDLSSRESLVKSLEFLVFSTQNPWHIAHSHLASRLQSNTWSESTEREWYRTEFLPLVPRSCCSDNWGPIAAKLDWSSAESAFRSFWAAHNEVSTKHVKPPLPAITYERCRALYLPQASMDDCCIAVTSLAPDRLERPTLCLDSWKRAGLTIAAVQAPGENLRDQYPQVTHWFTSESYGPPAINELADVAVKLDTAVLLINADIEIHGEQCLIREAINGGVLIGVRHNYKQNWWHGEAEKWGLDVFGITPEFARTLPRLDLRIGRPMWDYWMPYHCKNQGYAKQWINEPLFFHKSHKLNWTPADWQAGADVFMNHYGVPASTDWAEYRRGLERT